MASADGISAEDAGKLLGVGRSRVEQMLSARCQLLSGPNNFELRSPTAAPRAGVRPSRRLVDPASVEEFKSRHVRSSGGNRWAHPKRPVSQRASSAGPTDFFYLAAELDRLLGEAEDERQSHDLQISRVEDEQEALEHALVTARSRIQRLERQLAEQTRRGDHEASARRALHDDAVQKFGPQGSQDL